MAIRPTIEIARQRAGISETTLIPMNFETMYPANCEITSTVFRPKPNISASA